MINSPGGIAAPGLTSYVQERSTFSGQSNSQQKVSNKSSIPYFWTHSINTQRAFSDRNPKEATMPGKDIGYVRVSTHDQNTARQLDGVHLDKVFEEHASGKNSDRPALQTCLTTFVMATRSTFTPSTGLLVIFKTYLPCHYPERKGSHGNIPQGKARVCRQWLSGEKRCLPGASTAHHRRSRSV